MNAQTHTMTPADVLATWQQRSAPFTAEVDAVTSWDAPSPCEGWSALDVLEHVVDTESNFLTQRGLTLPPPAASAGTSESGPAARWAGHVRAVTELLSDPDVAAQPFDGVFGPTTVGETMTAIFGFDLIVHRWDLARSQGRDARLSTKELALIDTSVDGWGEHAYAPGIFAEPVPVPDGADEQTRVLARTGRRGS